MYNVMVALMEKTGYGEGLFERAELRDLRNASLWTEERRNDWARKAVRLCEMVLAEANGEGCAVIDPAEKILNKFYAASAGVFLRNACVAATSQIDTTPFVNQLLEEGSQPSSTEVDTASYAKLSEDLRKQAKRAADIDLDIDSDEERELLLQKHA